ncbi:MAG: thioredoxin family protein [Sulfurovum sp.]|nr:thioredoxin family protein [Sulfurovaceae bacterium]
MNLYEVEDIINRELGVLLYFSGEKCNVCHALRPKIKDIFDDTFPELKQIYLDANENPKISARYQVFSVPTIIVFMDRREFAREGRAISLYKLSEKLKRPYKMMMS